MVCAKASTSLRVGALLVGLAAVAGAYGAGDCGDSCVEFGGFGCGDGRGDVGESIEVAGGSVVAVRFHRFASFCCPVGVGSDDHSVEFVAQDGA